SRAEVRQCQGLIVEECSSLNAPGGWRRPLAGRNQRNRTDGASRSALELERRSDEHRSNGRKLVEVGEVGEPELAGAVHDGMIRKRRIVRGAYAGVGPDRFGAYPENVAL